jgi:hypothetical protein
VIVYAYTMKTGKGINPGPYGCDVKIAKPSGGGRVGPGTVKATMTHPKNKGGK